MAVGALGQTAYVVGGYDGARSFDSILAWRPGTAPRLVGRLPFGLRYAAVAPAAGRLIIAGGSSPSGVSDTIFSFDPATGSLKQVGRLPVPVTHASAAGLDGRVVLVGGRRQTSGGQTRSILEIDPDSGAVRQLGRLPNPLSDAAVATVGGKLVVAGGENAAGVQRSILLLSLRSSPGGAGP